MRTGNGTGNNFDIFVSNVLIYCAQTQYPFRQLEKGRDMADRQKRVPGGLQFHDNKPTRVYSPLILLHALLVQLKQEFVRPVKGEERDLDQVQVRQKDVWPRDQP
jgi:hypothetical protein